MTTREPPTFTTDDFDRADRSWGVGGWVIHWCGHNRSPQWTIHSVAYHYHDLPSRS